MTNKKAHKLMVALSKRVRIRESDEQQGRAQMKAGHPLPFLGNVCYHYLLSCSTSSL